jgi:hypothetical protein
LVLEENCVGRGISTLVLLLEEGLWCAKSFCFFVPPKEQRKMTRLSFIGLFLLIGKKHFSFLFWIVALILKMPSQNDGGEKFLLFVAPFLHIHVRKIGRMITGAHTQHISRARLYIYISVGFSFFIEIKKKKFRGL